MRAWILLLVLSAMAAGCDAGTGGEPGGGGGDAWGPGDAGGSTGEEGAMAGMTAAHNAYRLQAHDVPLAWDGGLAAYAQEWAEYLRDEYGCELQHRAWLGMDEEPYGENLYGATAWGMALSTSPQDVVDAWWSEEAYYDYATNSCTRVCGHYTQVMWKGSTHVGCGMAVCDGANGTTSDVWVCNYSPPGNWVGQKPW